MKNIVKVLVGNEHGGAAISSKAIIDNFIDEENFNVVFLCKSRFSKLFDSPKIENLSSFEPPILTSNHIVFKFLKTILFAIWCVYTMSLLILLIRKNKIKVIHTTNNHALLICLLCKLFIPNLYIISHWRCVGLASAKQYKFLLRKLDRIICISYSVKNSLPFDLLDKCIVIYDGVDVNEIYKSNIYNKSKLLTKLKVDSKNILLGTIGSYTPIKCHKLIIDCFVENKMNSDIKAVLIGSCPNIESEKYLKRLKKIVIQNKLQDQIHFIEDSELFPPKNYISDLDLFIGATWNNGLGEGFGLIYIESMAAKVPVLAIKVGAAGEIINDGINGFLINSNSPRELFDKVKSVDFEAINTIRESAYKTALDNFDISITMSKIKVLYEECLSFC